MIWSLAIALRRKTRVSFEKGLGDLATKILKPVKIQTDDFDDLEELISKLFKDELYLPIIKILTPSGTLKNSKEDLIDAINKRKISYHRGRFTGKFDSRTSREIKRLGGKWKSGGWSIASSQMPTEINAAIATSFARFGQTMARIDSIISQLLPERIAEKLKAKKIFDRALWRTHRSVNETIKGITVAADLGRHDREKIAEEYVHDMQRFIKDWTEKETVKLREEVQKHALSGKRYEDLVKTIEKRYQVSRSKAKFLARQETNLMMAKFKEARYTGMGINEYIWQTVVGSPKHPVRLMHKRLDGETFSWDNPPITSESGDRNNPGQDYNCRCVARPIVRF